MYGSAERFGQLGSGWRGAPCLQTARTRPWFLNAAPGQTLSPQPVDSGGGFCHTPQTIHHFSGRTKIHEPFPRCASRLLPPHRRRHHHHHHQQASQYVRATALYPFRPPHPPVPNAIIRSRKCEGAGRKRPERPERPSRGFFAGFCAGSRRSGSASFIQPFPSL